MSAAQLGNGLRVIDLTKQLDPETESRRCHLFRFNTGGPIPDFHTIMYRHMFGNDDDETDTGINRLYG